MSAAEKAAFAERWYRAGVCPGCGAALTAVAGLGVGHVRPNVRYGTDHQSFSGPDGAPVSAGNVGPNTCAWSPDDLTSLVLIATDFGRAPFSPGEPAAVTETAGAA